MLDRFVSMHSLTTFAGVLLNRDENQPGMRRPGQSSETQTLFVSV